MPEIDIRGINIHYIGSEAPDTSRPTVLLIHGAGQRIATWRFQTEHLKNSPDFNFIVPDLPGRGGSGGTGFRSIGEYTRFIEDFVSALGLDSLTLAGHSMGGGVVINYVLDHPERVKACVLVGTGARLRVAGETLKVVKNNYPLFCDVSPTRVFAENSPEELKSKFREDMLDTRSEVCYWDLTACDEFDFMGRVKEIETPSCVIAGALDLLAPAKYSEYLHNSINGSELHIIEDAGHFVMQEKPGQFNEAFFRFLDRNK